MLRILFAIVLFSTSVLAADNPISGSWKLNTSKGHLTPPIPKSSLAHIEADMENIKLSQEFVDDKGTTTNITFEAKFDGKEYPVAGDPESDFASIQRVNDHKFKMVFKKAGKVVAKEDLVVSKDGQTATLDYVDFGAEGKQEKGTAVYDKQ